MSAIAVASIASVGLGVATAAGAFTPKNAQPNVGQLTGNQIAAVDAATPGNYQTQAQYNPQFAALNSTIAWQNLFGVPATSATPAVPGELQTAAAAQPQLLAMQSAGRAADIADVAKLGPGAQRAIAGYNPAVTNLYGTMDQQAQDLVNQNGALDPFTQTALQQSYRAGEAARGLAGGSSDAAMEAYYQAATQEQRRLTNLQAAGTVAGQTAGYYGDPFQQVLARTSGGVQTPGVSYTADQPSATGATASLLNPGITDLQGQGYQVQVGTNNAGYAQRQQAIGSLITPGANGNSPLSTSLSGLYNYFAAPGSTGAVG